MKAVLYLRASTNKQEYSPEAQRGALLRYCEYREHEVVGLWGDKALSGRKNTERLIGRAEAVRVAKALGAGACLVVYSLSRLGRSSKELVTIIDDLLKSGVTVVTIVEGIDTSTSAGRMISTILAAVAQFEAEAISERTSAGLAVAKGKGILPGPKAQDDPEVVGIVRELRAGGASAAVIAFTLNSRGFLTTKGKLFTHVQVARMLRRAA